MSLPLTSTPAQLCWKPATHLRVAATKPEDCAVAGRILWKSVGMNCGDGLARGRGPKQDSATGLDAQSKIFPSSYYIGRPRVCARVCACYRVAPTLSLCASEGQGPELWLLNVATRRTRWAYDTSGGRHCLRSHSVGPVQWARHCIF